MENQKTVSIGKTKAVKSKEKMSKKDLARESLRALTFGVFALLLGTREMLFETYPLAFALLASSARQTPFVLLGLIISAWSGGEFSLPKVVGACATVALRIFVKFFLDKDENAQPRGRNLGMISVFSTIFSEHTYLRMMSGAVGVFFIGIWKIIEGGFRFYDLFAAIFYLILTPVATWLFSPYFNLSERRDREKKAFAVTPTEERFYDISCALLICSLIFSLDSASFAGLSLPILIALSMTLYASRKGVLYGVLAGLVFGVSFSTVYAPMFAFCAIAYASINKLSRFGAGIASCIAGLVWGIYVGGLSSLGTVFPSLFTASMIYCTAERINIFDDIERFFTPEESSKIEIDDFSAQTLVAEQRVNLQDEKLKSISDAFSTLSEIFYNLSSKLKRPTMLDLRTICEENFEKLCDTCENREICFGAEYGSTLDAMKKMTVQLHSTGFADEKKLSDSFKKRCSHTKEIVENVNRACAIATKKAFQNEKTEIFAFDYDAIAKILNDAIAENEEEFRADTTMSKKIARAIAEEGYGDHNVVIFGKRKLKILARGLDLSDKTGDITKLKDRLEQTARVALCDPTFELAFGSVNMQIEARRAFSAESAFATASSDGETVCGDTVSIFENKNDYLYALISDGMGTGKSAALTSEMCSVFLRNMLNAGNRMETSLRMLNSVLRAKGSKSEMECSATVDLLQFDLYSGALMLVKSGAAPTFVLRRGNVFKLSSPSFPIGILRALDAKQIDISCEDGDVVVMVSDGATREGDDCAYLTEMLRDPRIAGEAPSKIADKIIRRARAERDIANDDISVVVIKVKKEICNW